MYKPRFIFIDKTTATLKREFDKKEAQACIIEIDGSYFILQGNVPMDMYYQEVEVVHINSDEVSFQ